MGRDTTIFEHIQTPDAAVEDIRKLQTCLKFYVLSSGTIAGDRRKVIRLVLAVANNPTIKISRGEVSEHVQKPDAVTENRRKALGLVVQLVTISKDHQYVCWLVSGSCVLRCSLATFSMSWHTVHFTIYRVAESTIWSSGAGIVFLLSLSKDILSFDLQGKHGLKLGSKQIICIKIYTFIRFSKMLLPRPQTHFYKYNFKPDLIKILH